MHISKTKIVSYKNKVKMNSLFGYKNNKKNLVNGKTDIYHVLYFLQWNKSFSVLWHSHDT